MPSGRYRFSERLQRGFPAKTGRLPPGGIFRDAQADRVGHNVDPSLTGVGACSDCGELRVQHVVAVRDGVAVAQRPLPVRLSVISNVALRISSTRMPVWSLRNRRPFSRRVLIACMAEAGGVLDGLADAGNLVGWEVVHDDDVAGLQRRREGVADIDAEGIAVHRAIEQPGAVTPSWRRAATKVMVFPCPNGAVAFRRAPLGARPWRRVILVLTPVSSMKTSRAGSMKGCAARRRSRAAATPGRSCSEAVRLFFCTSGRGGRRRSTWRRYRAPRHGPRPAKTEDAPG